MSELFRKKEDNFLNTCLNLYFSKNRNSHISEGKSGGTNFEIILPQTFMNHSGDAFSGIFKNSSKKELIKNIQEIENIIVMYDDIALPFGEIKISFGRGDGGHNGIKDITKKLGTKNYIRIRIGVCPIDFFGKCRKPKKGDAVTKYLTRKKFSRKQGKMVQETEKKTEEILKYILKNDYKKAMNKFN